MCELIARLLQWAERLLRGGRGELVADYTPPPSDPWAQPWATPTPVHVIERHCPLRGEDSRLVRPYAPADDTLELRQVRPRRRLLYAAMGLDLPITTRGASV
ncbi:hypothetical protein [Streptomyces albipurpureus]|uniref:Transposase n=1 Tax=Streptomyces albipurpureus TaxID=2897419 RepID=A0ABT0UXV4_9ACTN|nr:hypothetical protein [Streptomyces sp. CWNU-1]MCM2393301.1 hypothetical protein [Streptomyces sp. CWNU-1]